MTLSGKKILVCGGAGYIGSHMNKMLSENGFRTVVLDNLSTGHREAVKWGEFFAGDLLSREDLERLFRIHEFDAVMHFSAFSVVRKSTEDPAEYYRNNVLGTLNLLDAMRDHDIGRFIFSSTAAVYGEPDYTPIDELHPRKPINPYGRTKAVLEDVLRDYHTAYGLNSVALRYFNAAGSDPGGEIGEEHDPETHLIPNILKSLLGAGMPLRVFGDDYDTPDGTCIRDYVHVNDLCTAHLKALAYLDEAPGAHALNLGNGEGFSVLSAIRAAEEVTGAKVAYEVVGRQPGDPPALIADSRKANRELGWTPALTDIRDIIETAWNWHRGNR